jgi:hypothetical protein
MIRGMDWAGPGDFEAIAEPSNDLVETKNGLFTRMEGHEVRIYLTR